MNKDKNEMPKNDSEWKEKLSQEEYRVLRQKGTEAPFSGKYVREKKAGTYNCKACGNPLFSSETKFETHLPGLMGWPSFEDAIADSVKFKPDNSMGMRRTEVVCKNCGAHLGHVFDDELETKTGKHYCVNSVCLELEEKKK